MRVVTGRDARDASWGEALRERVFELAYVEPRGVSVLSLVVITD